MIRHLLLFWTLGAVLLPSIVRGQAIEVDPREVTRRKDLIGKQIVVDDRVKFFAPHPGRNYDEILVRSSSITLRLPPGLRYESQPKASGVRAVGTLRKEGDNVFLDVTSAPELFVGDDRKRLDNEVARLIPDDAEGRYAWADWAIRRGVIFKDEAMTQSGSKLKTDAFLLEAGRPSIRDPEKLLSLVRRGRERGVPEVPTSAIVHRALVLKLSSARTADEFDQIASETVDLLPRSREPQALDVKSALSNYEKDPVGTYMQADDAGRAALDRRLRTESLSRGFAARKVTTPSDYLALADQAARQLPERPEIASDFRIKALAATADNVTNLRQSEMLELARTYREEKKQPEKALALIRTWLDHYRNKILSPTDAEGRVSLAEQYFKLLKDRATAAEILRSALAIDPQSRASFELFQRMGFRRLDGEWIDGASGSTAPLSSPTAPSSDDPFIGLSPSEVKSRLGEPNRTSRVASQGRVTIQWVYDGAKGTTKGTQYIDFLQLSRDSQASVVGRYASK